MVDFFMSHSYMDINQGQRQLPTLDQLVNLFESLDKNKNGYLTSEDFRSFIESIDKLKRVDFDLDRYIAELNDLQSNNDQALAGAQTKTDGQREMEMDIDKLLMEFDLD